MDVRDAKLDQRIDVFLDAVGDGLRSRTQRDAFGRYVIGLLSDAERKSIEPIAARTRPEHGSAEHQALHYFVADAPWNDHAVRRAAAAVALWTATTASPVRVAVIDDTGFLKKGVCSVGVARQYTGSAGKITNCQVAVSLAVATEHDTVPLDMALYLPQTWAFDEDRRRTAKVPDDILFQPKWDIALDLLRAARAEHVPLGDVVLADEGYGAAADFRRGVTDLGVAYGVAVAARQRVHYRGRLWTVRELADTLRPRNYDRITWRQGTHGRLSARFALRRVRVSNTHGVPHGEGTAQWLVIEWRDGEDRPLHFHLTTLPVSWSRKRLVRTIKERWRTERLYQDLKTELGLDHFQGRSWIGWNHHVSVTLACYALLVSQRTEAFPPEAPGASTPCPVCDAA